MPYAITDHEYTLNGGTSVAGDCLAGWDNGNGTATIPASVIGDTARAAGQVGVRVKAATGRDASAWLFNAEPFTTTTVAPGTLIFGDSFNQANGAPDPLKWTVQNDSPTQVSVGVVSNTLELKTLVSQTATTGAAQNRAISLNSFSGPFEWDSIVTVEGGAGPLHLFQFFDELGNTCSVTRGGTGDTFIRLLANIVGGTSVDVVTASSWSNSAIKIRIRLTGTEIIWYVSTNLSTFTELHRKTATFGSSIRFWYGIQSSNTGTKTVRVDDVTVTAL